MNLHETVEQLAHVAFPDEEPADFFVLSVNWSPVRWFKPARAKASADALPEGEWVETQAREEECREAA